MRSLTYDKAHLQATALRVREHIIGMAGGGGCFIGASLSCADLLVHLYSRVLALDPQNLTDPGRDYLLLSKGHDVPALYGTFAELGLIERERLARHLDPTDHVYWHPNRSIPGIEFHSGSLGHLLSVGIGVALDMKLRGTSNRVFVILGDGELNEGSIWEGLLVAAAHGLDNLVAVVDRNGFQANEATEALIPLEPLAAKFQAFGCSVREVDGHDFDDLERTFTNLIPTGRPQVVIAHTVRGKGLPSLENRADRWFVRLRDEEVAMLRDELAGHAPAHLTSAPLIVR
ncbi:MAG: transketolase [Myxococcales bacterium]|nr:transketolase [Myxococcales bacterium]